MSKRTKAGRRAAFRRHCAWVADQQARFGTSSRRDVRRVFTTMPMWRFTVNPYTSQRNVTGGWR